MTGTVFVFDVDNTLLDQVQARFRQRLPPEINAD